MRKEIVLGTILIIFACFNPVFADEIDFKNIPEDLKKDANAIVRYDYSEFQVNSIKSAKFTSKFAITILNKNGDDFANLHIYYDKFIKVSDINGKIYDNEGKLIKKIKLSDFTDQSISSGATLYDDSRIKFYEVFQNKYPYTVEYEYTIDFSGYIHFPMWFPIDSYNLSVEKSDYVVKINPELDFHFKSVNIIDTPLISEEKGLKVYKWSIQAFRALNDEPYSPYLSETTPAIYFAPNNFYYDGTSGNQETWKELGKWAYQLLIGRDQLTDKTKKEIHALISNQSDDKEKARLLYEYMQSKTRYVSIQLGIGGFQPFAAIEVDQLGYGDCKALSNYMVAILKEAEIESNYAIVNAGKHTKAINTDFSSVSQMNHVIVCVPFEKDTIWLECTSQDMPFGYLSSFTDNRKALLIKPEGGILANTTKYFQNENVQSRKILADLSDDGSLVTDITTTYKAIQYDNISYQFRESKEDQKKNLYKNLDLTNFDILELNYIQNKERIPVATEQLKLKLNQYANFSGERMFLPMNLLNKHEYIPKRIVNRKTEIVFNFAYSDYDTVIYKIPEKYSVEFIPDTVEINNQFGNFLSYVTKQNDSLIYVRTDKRNEGSFPAKSYNELIDFYKQIVKADNQKAILIKKQ